MQVRSSNLGKFPVWQPCEPDFKYGLVSVVVSSWGNGRSVDVVVANNR